MAFVNAVIKVEYQSDGTVVEEGTYTNTSGGTGGTITAGAPTSGSYPLNQQIIGKIKSARADSTVSNTATINTNIQGMNGQGYNTNQVVLTTASNDAGFYRLTGKSGT